ncbi:MAG: MBL fold metallo-hydrolase [Clostridia bacterium]|nr:MBL fold metallo-hydrolase [Clostridia bacterium]
MKILFLGTGAADWQKEKMSGEHRRNASLLIDDILLIDPGPGVLDAAKEFSVDLSKIRYVLCTHTHADHFNASTLKELQKYGAVFITVPQGEVKRTGDYKVHALKANHSIDATHYIISRGRKRIFYGLDGAWLLYDEVQAIKEKKIDFAVFDATVGNVEGDYRVFEHNNLNMVIEMKKSLGKYIDRFCISHMARTLHDSHTKLSEQMKLYGIEVAFDGFLTEI